MPLHASPREQQGTAISALAAFATSSRNPVGPQLQWLVVVTLPIALRRREVAILAIIILDR
jgi:hypothetical protein